MVHPAVILQVAVISVSTGLPRWFYIQVIVSHVEQHAVSSIPEEIKRTMTIICGVEAILCHTLESINSAISIDSH